mmetsp:Transcript_9264/g.18949  ORF Transcript_9264/g.18949 Transcript_9264/m.18949 type:complete len:145 (-) Transcript_9264:232-666(-)
MLFRLLLGVLGLTKTRTSSDHHPSPAIQSESSVASSNAAGSAENKPDSSQSTPSDSTSDEGSVTSTPPPADTYIPRKSRRISKASEPKGNGETYIELIVVSRKKKNKGKSRSLFYSVQVRALEYSIALRTCIVLYVVPKALELI